MSDPLHHGPDAASVLRNPTTVHVWQHRWAGGENPMVGRHGTTAGWMPFHKLSQRLSHSRLQPCESAGGKVIHSHQGRLTSLPEYRNGSALPGGLAPLVSARLGRTAEQMPLACMPKSCAWANNRVLARELRASSPPLHISSNGTVF